MEKTLLSSIEIFKEAVESASNHIIITDTDGYILYANRSAQKITGYDLSQMLGNTPRVWGTQMPREYYTGMWRTIKTNKEPFRGEIKNKRKNGDIYDALVVISPILDEKSKLIGFIGTEEDITQLKKTEAELKRQNDQLTKLTNIMVDRELRMVELKKMLNDAKKKLNPEYS